VAAGFGISGEAETGACEDWARAAVGRQRRAATATEERRFDKIAVIESFPG